MAERNIRNEWDAEDAYWRTSYPSRPYASSSREYDYYRPGYRYGYEAANRYHDRQWNEVESDLSKSWNSYEHRGSSTWEQMKDAVRDAWDRVTGHRPVSSR
jgi:hypothetical protein